MTAPWSIAGAVPLAAVGAPTQPIAAAFLCLLPLHRLASEDRDRHRDRNRARRRGASRCDASHRAAQRAGDGPAATLEG